MSAQRAASVRLAAAAAIGLCLAGCFAARRPPPPPTRVPPSVPPPPAAARAPAPQSVPDAVPRYEPRSPYGNPPFYDVFGKRYFVLSSSADYVERGVASWYGPGFHEELTSTHEPYDMYAMTAAHKTLPLPCYVRVTNLQNGRSVVVRVNDRGPFVGNRIIDLSYTAAAKLDMLRDGTAMVEVRTVGPTSPSGGIVTASNRDAAPFVSKAVPLPAAAAPAAAGARPAQPPAIAPAPVTSAPASSLFVQAGAFADPANAERLAGKLRVGGYGKVFIRDDVVAGRRMYRVRIGPVPDVPQFDRIVTALERVGVRDAHLALD